MPNSHTEIYLHVVWATWDREPLIAPEIEARLYACIAARCRDMQTHLIAIGGVADHIHVLIRMSATRTVAQVVGDIKGASSHLMTHELGLHHFRWQGAYGARSVSPNGLEAVCAYIHNQKENHAQNTVRTAWELTSESSFNDED